MKKYITTAKSLRIQSGTVMLDENQAQARAHQLEALGNGIYRIVSPIEFKSGETIGYEGDVPPALAQEMKEAGEIKRSAITAAAKDKPSGKPVATPKEPKADQVKTSSATETTEISAEKQARKSAKIAWGKDADLRAKFNNDFKAYMDSISTESGEK